MDTTRRTLLITLSGNDRPGVTRRLFSTLQGHAVTVLDVEQLVVRGRLILAVLVEVTGDDEAMASVRTAMRHAAADQFPTVSDINAVTIHTETAGPDFMDEAASIYLGSQDFRVTFSETR